MLDDIFLKPCPTLDLHGYDKLSAKMQTKDFIKENIILGNKKVVIIHGIGLGIVRSSVHEELKINKDVLSYKLDSFNVGCTIVHLK